MGDPIFSIEEFNKSGGENGKENFLFNCGIFVHWI
jgi:hypothetical protein